MRAKKDFLALKFKSSNQKCKLDFLSSNCYFKYSLFKRILKYYWDLAFKSLL